MKKYFIIGIILICVVGFSAGIYVYKINKIENTKIANSEFSIVTDECTEIAELYELGMLNIKEVSSKDELISPNANITFEIYYKQCNHYIKNKEKVTEDLVNLSQEELKNKYREWQIKKYASEDIILYKEIDNFCNEHYVLKNRNGYIVVYKLDENNKESLFKETDICTKYLETEDLKKMKDGFKINTKQELNKVLEDYE